MDLFIKNGMVLVGDHFQPMNMIIRDGRIASLGNDINTSSLPELDAGGKHIVPGFIDVHTHGGTGVDVNHATVSNMIELSQFFASQGVTAFLVSLATDSETDTVRAIGEIKKAMPLSAESGAAILGIHLEGPFLCPDYKGAMAEQYLRTTDTALFDSYWEKSGGTIRYLTISPEIAGIQALIRKAADLGVVVAMGHSGADYETAMACIDLGVSASTHTFNGMKPLHQHFPAVTGAALESDIYCEAITDGRHLHPAIVRLMLKTKGYDRVVVVTDSMMAAGLPDGRYMIAANEVDVVAGDARLVLDGTRAGSTLTMIDALKNVMAFTGEKLEKVIPLLTRNPARLLHLDDRKGNLAVGKDADMVILDGNLDVERTLVGGKTVYSTMACDKFLG